MARDECPALHCSKVNGIWQQGDADTYGETTIANGTIQIQARCNLCGVHSSPIPRVTWQHWMRDGAELTWKRRSQLTQGCIVIRCFEPFTELHHFAPYNTFGSDADLWPVLPLCRRHHEEWHHRMNGYRSNRTAAA